MVSKGSDIIIVNHFISPLSTMAADIRIVMADFFFLMANPIALRCGMTAVGADVGTFRCLVLTHDRLTDITSMIGIGVAAAGHFFAAVTAAMGAFRRFMNAHGGSANITFMVSGFFVGAITDLFATITTAVGSCGGSVFTHGDFADIAAVIRIFVGAVGHLIAAIIAVVGFGGSLMYTHKYATDIAGMILRIFIRAVRDLPTAVTAIVGTLRSFVFPYG
jgi:hypothetical protein